MTIDYCDVTSPYLYGDKEMNGKGLGQGWRKGNWDCWFSLCILPLKFPTHRDYSLPHQRRTQHLEWRAAESSLFQQRQKWRYTMSYNFCQPVRCFFRSDVLYFAGTLLPAPTAVAGEKGFFTSLCLCVCLFFSHDISENDATRITKLGIEMFHDESWKPVYLGVTRSKVKVTSHQKPPSWVFAFLWVLASSSYFYWTFRRAARYRLSWLGQTRL